MHRKKFDQVLESEERRMDIERLLKEKKYDDIFTRYGQNIYLKTVPYKVRKKDVENLFKQGRYEEIYIKHRRKKYEIYLDKMREIDVLTETGSKTKGVIERIKYWFKIKFAPLLLAVSLSIIAAPTTASLGYESVKKINEIKHAKKIEEYNEYIQKYAQEIKDMNLTDTQIFIKVIDDMWKEINGYAEPQNEIIGYPRITLRNEGVGMCGNFADDMTAKLNAINPEYNARNLIVYMSDNDYYMFDIERNILSTEETERICKYSKETLNDIVNKTGIKKINRKSYGNSFRRSR